MADRKPSLQRMLGSTVTMQIDRPLGSSHPDHPELIYPIHYGYIPDLMGGDGELQDAYLMGVTQPVSQFTGKVIGIVRRYNDREDKLVIAPDDCHYHQAEIADAVYFVEQYFRHRIIPLYHRSCGAVIYRKNRSGFRYLLLFQRGSHTWSFPKGHMERLESEECTALREVREEVGMRIHLHPGFRGEARYAVGNGEKTVVLFLAKATTPPVMSAHEVLASKWVTLSEAEALLHPSYIQVLRDAEQYLIRHTDLK